MQILCFALNERVSTGRNEESRPERLRQGEIPRRLWLLGMTALVGFSASCLNNLKEKHS